MDDRIAKFVKDLALEKGVSHDVIIGVQHDLSVVFPVDYVEFIQESSGAEGVVGDSYLVLWSIEDLGPKNIAYRVKEFAPGLLIFGSDGAGEAYAFTIGAKQTEIVNVPFIGMGIEDPTFMGNTFTEFLESLHA